MKVRSLLTLNSLLIFVPVAFGLAWIPPLHHELALFICSSLAIVPLAGWMSTATEHLASRMGQGVGGLLNATFGNAAELIIALVALSRGLTGVVKASLTGSIIGNILLVLGMSILGGGLRYPEQVFNRSGARVSATCLSLASIALIIPSIFHFAAGEDPAGWTRQLSQHLSLAIAVILFITYGCQLVFSLITHRDLFKGEAAESDEEEVWPARRAAFVLLVATVLVAFLSEFLVGTLEVARKALGLTETFVGIVIVAVVGNAAEHSSSIIAAVKNKMDLSLTIAVGSSIQMALFVAPLLVFVSYAFGQPMDLEFSLPEVFSIVVAVYIVFQIAGDGETNWLEGVQLLSVYLILAVLFFFLPEMR